MMFIYQIIISSGAEPLVDPHSDLIRPAVSSKVFPGSLTQAVCNFATVSEVLFFGFH
jgi:hypothetical protein